jgi:hypothetical protein
VQEVDLMFVRASRLYDPRTGSRLLHPAYQATDERVRRALAEVECR